MPTGQNDTGKDRMRNVRNIFSARVSTAGTVEIAPDLFTAYRTCVLRDLHRNGSGKTRAGQGALRPNDVM